MQIYLQQNNFQTFQGANISIPKAELENLLAKDKTIEQIARKFGVSGKTIRNRIAEYNLQLPSEKLRERFQNEAFPLLEQGIPAPVIRQLTGIPESYIKMWVQKNSYPSSKEIRDQRIVELFNLGKTDEEIADILCISEATIARKRQKKGCHKLNGRPAILKNTPVLDEIKSGASVEAVADKYKVSVSTIIKYVNKNNELTPKKLQIENKKSLIDGYLYKGYSISQIADELGEKKDSVYRFIQRHLPEWIGHRNK